MTSKAFFSSFLVLTLLILTSADAGAQQLDDSNSKPLVLRDRIDLTLAGAELALFAARQKAEEMGVRVNISVVDDGGHLWAFARMDGARPGSIATSMTKATSAATKRGATGPLPNAESVNTQLSLAVENAASVSGGKFTTLKGGIPIIIDEQVIGAVGVGGATGEQDAEVAQAGVDALVQRLSQKHSATADLIGNWLVEDLEGRGVLDRVQTTIRFAEDGSVSGNTGVNQFTGSATISEQTIEFGPVIATKRAAAPALMDQESRFLNVLENTERFEFDQQHRLHFLDGQGERRLTATRLDAKK